ncbi:hypothetical protein [Mitsuokella multacida]|uniref:hypothetical protein n=1 Tax=Mitsuokella multacida TaxID=52226 RepID=UPI0022DFE569|nr:hypothetical protein [Mitsuokella multacida]
MNIDLLGGRFQLGHVDGIRIQSTSSQIIQLTGNGSGSDVAIPIPFFCPADGNGFVRGLPD